MDKKARERFLTRERVRRLRERRALQIKQQRGHKDWDDSSSSGPAVQDDDSDEDHELELLRQRQRQVREEQERQRQQQQEEADARQLLQREQERVLGPHFFQVLDFSYEDGVFPAENPTPDDMERIVQKFATIKVSSEVSDEAVEKLFAAFCQEMDSIQRLFLEKRLTSSYRNSIRPRALEFCPTSVLLLRHFGGLWGDRNKDGGPGAPVHPQGHSVPPKLGGQAAVEDLRLCQVGCPRAALLGDTQEARIQRGRD